MKKTVSALLLSVTAFAVQADVQTSASGSTVTYRESFNHGTLDDSLFLSNVSDSSYSFNFTSAQTSEIALSFWYAAPSWGGGTVAISKAGTGVIWQQNLGNSTNIDSTGLDPFAKALAQLTSGLQFAGNNPGPDNWLPGSSFDRELRLDKLGGIAAGTYSLSFAVGSGARLLKVDDIRLSVTAVPEPGSFVMLLAGLGIIGMLAGRRRRIA